MTVTKIINVLIGATALRGAAVFGQGTGKVWVNVPQCTLDSTSLDNCTFATPLGDSHNCGHNADAGVICFSNFGMDNQSLITF